MSLFNVLHAEEDDDDDNIKPQTNPPKTGLNVNNESQQQAGIVTQVTALSYYQPEFIAYGKALSSEPLSNLYHRYLMAQSQQQGTAAVVTQLAQNTQRQADLYAHGISPQRLVQEQQAQWQSQKSILTSEQVQTKSIINEAVLLWGETLSHWLRHKPNELQVFFTGEKTLIQITLSNNKKLSARQKIYVSATGQRETAELAQFISIAPNNMTGIQGLSYFIQVPSQSIRAGMNVTAWITENISRQSGIIIPKSALIWSMEQALVYIKNSDNQFKQRVINHYTVTPTGYFISTDELKAGETIVITGAQQLLSEELRQHIPDEDD